MDNLLTITVDYDKKEEVRLSLSFFVILRRPLQLFLPSIKRNV